MSKPARTLAAALCAVGLGMWSGGAWGQDGRTPQRQGSTGAAISGAGLGLLVGYTIVGMAAYIPCSADDSALHDINCFHVPAVLGAFAGTAAGMAIGAGDDERVWDAAVGTGLGALGGMAVGTLYAVITDKTTAPVTLTFLGAAVGTIVGAIVSDVDEPSIPQGPFMMRLARVRF